MKKGNTIIVFVILLFSFFALCTFSLDASVLTTSRYRFQKAVEMTSLLSVQHVNHSDINEIASNTFTIFTRSNPIMQSAILDDIETRDNKIMLMAHFNSPTCFLGLLGINTIRLNATSYAQMGEITNHYATDNIIELDEILTDKQGNDFKITFNTSGDFAILGGIERNNETFWQNLSCKNTEGELYTKTPSGNLDIDNNLEYLSVNSGDTINFDLSKECSPSHISGIVQKIKVIPLNLEAVDFDFTILNNVKLISRDEYLL